MRGILVGIVVFSLMGIPAFAQDTGGVSVTFGSSNSKPKSADLIGAAATGDYATVRSLIAAGIDVNGKDENDHTALWWAMKNGHQNVVELLKQAGATE